MELKRIFDVFSRRELPASGIAAVPEATRNRVLLWCRDVFSGQRASFGSSDCTAEFWDEIHRTLQMRHGRVQLAETRYYRPSAATESVAFLLECDDASFLDFLEYIFRLDCLHRVGVDEDRLVREINDILRVDDLPYHLTDFVRESITRHSDGPPSFGGTFTYEEVVSRPVVISCENEVVHLEMTKPALDLLKDPRFKQANVEYLEALADYRQGDTRGALANCGSAFESVMKVLCEINRWPYQQQDTAAILVKTVLEHTGLDSYFESTLMIIATLRNRLSKSHGAGMAEHEVAPHLAAYALNATASAILLLFGEAGVRRRR